MGQDKQAPKQETLHMPMKQHHSLSLLHFWHSAVINCIESDLLCSFLAVRSKGKLIDAALLKPGFLLAVTNMHNSQGMARMGFENNKEYLVWRFPGFPVKHLSSHYSVFHQLQQETYIHSISVYSMYIYIYQIPIGLDFKRRGAGSSISLEHERSDPDVRSFKPFPWRLAPCAHFMTLGWLILPPHAKFELLCLLFWTHVLLLFDISFLHCYRAQLQINSVDSSYYPFGFPCMTCAALPFGDNCCYCC